MGASRLSEGLAGWGHQGWETAPAVRPWWKPLYRKISLFIPKALGSGLTH